MQTVQMTLDESLVRDVDLVVKQLGTTRSAFARDALKQALGRVHMQKLEKRQRDGYARKPVKKGEFDAWENEQAWGDE